MDLTGSPEKDLTNRVTYSAVFRIRVFSGSGSAKNPDPIRENPDLDPCKKSPKTARTGRTILYFIFSNLNTVLFGQVHPKPNKKHNLDPISFLMDGSGL